MEAAHRDVPDPAGGDPRSKQQIAPYRAAKDTVRFPYKKPIPYDLIDAMVAMLVRRRLDSENDPPNGS